MNDSARLPWPIKLGSALALIVLLNIRGVDSGKWLNNICSVGSLLPLGVLMMMAAVLPYFFFKWMKWL